MQILLANSDLRAANLEVLLADKITIFPFYDFEYCGTINLNLYRYYREYLLKYDSRPRNKEIPFDTLKIFLNSGTHKEIELFKDYLERIKEVQLTEIFAEIKEQTKYNMPEGVKRVLKIEIKDNLQNVDSIIKGDFH